MTSLPKNKESDLFKLGSAIRRELLLRALGVIVIYSVMAVLVLAIELYIAASKGRETA